MSVEQHTVVPRARRLTGWLFAMILVLAIAIAALPATTARAAGPTTFSNTAAIVTTDSTTAPTPFVAVPYPSPIAVSALPGLITSVSITLNSVNATTAGDLDALLVSPTGANFVVISDIGPANSYVTATNATYTLADGGSAFPSTPGANVPSGTYAPTNNPAGNADSFPAPAPAPSSHTTFASAFAGANPNGTWSLYVVDDASGDPVTISGGWSLTISTAEAAAATTTTLTSSANPSTLGNAVTFTATVASGGEPVTAGTVTITAAGTAKAATVDNTGKATATFPTLPEGTYVVAATYGGTTGFAPSSDSLTQIVDRTTTVTGSSYCNTGPITIPDQGTATPYPSRLAVSGQAGTITDVQVRLLGVSHTSPTDLDILLVGPDPTHNLILLSDIPTNDPISDADLTFSDAATATLGDSPGTGTYQPANGAGTDSFPAPAPTPSSATKLATFDGASADGTWSLYVVDDASADSGTIAGGWCVDLTTAQATTTTLTAAPNPVGSGQSTTLTATVAAGGSPVAQGNVAFNIDGTPVGSPVPVDANGKATFSTSGLSVGSHVVTASYDGAAGYAASSSAPLTLTVAKAATATQLTGPSGTLSYGDSATVTATVTAATVPLTSGVVRFSIGSLVLADVSVANGSAAYTLTNLAVGDVTVTATYLGTTSYSGSSDALTLSVAPLATSIVITPDPVSPAPGQQVHYEATISHLGSPVTAGTAQLSVDGSPMGGPTQVTPAGVATWDITELAIGTHTIRVDYSGAQGWAASWAEITQSVDPVANAGGPYTVAEGHSLTLDASGSSAGASIGWDLNGDGDFTDATGVAPVLTWAELEVYGIDDGPASLTVSVRVTVAGRTSTAAATVTVVNTAPTVTVTGSLTATAGVPFTIKIGALDPSAADAAATFGYTIDWGDGSPLVTVSGPADPPVTHTYATAGTYTAFATATDKDGGGSAGITITVVAQAAPAGPTTAPPTTAPPTTAPPTTAPPALAGTGVGPLLAPVGLAALALLVGALALLVPRRRGRRR